MDSAGIQGFTTKLENDDDLFDHFPDEVEQVVQLLMELVDKMDAKRRHERDEHLCQGCGREESSCSNEPCAAVQEDRNDG